MVIPDNGQLFNPILRNSVILRFCLVTYTFYYCYSFYAFHYLPLIPRIIINNASAINDPRAYIIFNKSFKGIKFCDILLRNTVILCIFIKFLESLLFFYCNENFTLKSINNLIIIMLVVKGWIKENGIITIKNASSTIRKHSPFGIYYYALYLSWLKITNICR